MTSPTVPGRVAEVLGSYASDRFGVMGNGKVDFLDRAGKQGLRFTASATQGAAIFTVTRDAAGAVTRQAVEYALGEVFSVISPELRLYLSPQ